MLFIPEFPWSDLHTLNLDWLLSVVASHERQLRDIEGSASPYDEAPLPDGIADPGSVNQFARGDHRHPTDTTRASVTALQAVQDSVPGPSNGNPRMDGTANPGTYTYYSRADHVHPSDTSKLDKTGGEVNGLLDIKPRRCQAASLPSAGWYRAVAYNADNNGNGEFAFIVTLKITRAMSTGNEVHEIKFLASSNRLLFADELSSGNAASINKIRYTYNPSTGYAYIDIHALGALSNAVTVDFDVATILANRSKFNAAALQSVADSPSGETVIAEYTFVTNTTVATNGYVPTISFLDGSSISISSANARYEMKGRLLRLTGRFTINSMSASTNTYLSLSFPPGITIPENEPAIVGFCTNSTKTWGIRCDGSKLYLADGGGSASKPQLTAGSYQFDITAFV